MMHTTTTSYRPNDFLLRNSTHWTHRLPSTAIMGLITIIGLLILTLILDALRNHMSFHMKCNCFPTKKKRQNQEKNQEIQDKEESENIEDNKEYHRQIEENKHSEYGSMKNPSGQSPLLHIKEENHYVEQEIKDLQGTVKSLQKEIMTYYPIIKID